jgi:eudesmane-5,11-diol synthase
MLLNIIACRWDLSAVSEVPEYLRRLYIRTLEGFQKFDDMLEPNEKYAMHYVIKAVSSSLFSRISFS